MKSKAKLLSKPWLSGIPFWQKVRGIKDITSELYRLRKRFRFKLSDINDNLVGNPCYYKIGKANVTDLSIRMFFYSRYIEKEFPKLKNILEIGGGFGGLCLKLISSKNLDVKIYILVELPEILPLSYWYLRNSGCKIFVIISEHDDINLAGNKNDDKTVVLVAPWMLPKLNLDFDIFINTMSLQHMTKENIDYYFSEINRLNVKNLFLVNRDIIRDPTDIKISDYPISQKYRLIKQDNYLFTNHLIKIYRLKNKHV